MFCAAWFILGVVLALGDDAIQQPTRAVPQPQCVRITVQDRGNSMSHGTATYLGAGLVATVQHNVRDTRSRQVQIVFPQDATYMATIIHEDKVRDICILLLEGVPKCQGVNIRMDLPEVGEPLAVQGYATGAYRQAWGTMSHRKYGPANLSHTWYAINGAQSRQGDSGGPIFDAEGRWVGTLWGSCSDYGGETQFTAAKDIVKIILDLGKKLPQPEPTVKPDDPVIYKPGQKFAGRYHNRTRTKKFFRRAA
ncbi:MAG: S1 family peptidase [Planctomycetota bacterium]